MKICTRCKEEKPKTEFYKRKDSADGLLGHCKACQKARTVSYNRSPERMAKRREEMRERRKKPHGYFRRYVDAAKSRDYLFELTEKEFLTFWQKPCYYCGTEILTIGLDRVDNTRGYSLDNVVPCCTHCNKMKLDLTQEDFYHKLLSVVKHLNLKREVKKL